MSGYNTECPSCGGMNYYYTPHNNFGYCFSPYCGYKNSDGINTRPIIRSDHKEEIREYYTKMAQYYHSSLIQPAIYYLHNRGYTDELIQKKKIGFCPPGTSHLYKGKIPKEAGLVVGEDKGFFANRITFPYILNNNEISDIRARYILRNGNEIKYKSPYGSNYTRWSDYPYNYYLHNEQHILLTESEIKADIALLCGYNALGLPGMGIWKRGWVPREDQVVTIVFDNQRANYHNVQEAIHKVASRFINPKIAVLPLLGKDKAEIDTFVLEQGKEFFDSIVRNATDYTTWSKLQ